MRKRSSKPRPKASVAVWPVEPFAPPNAFAAPNPLGAGEIPPPPRHIVMLAGVLCFLSLLGAIALTRRRAFTPLARWIWVVACGVIGLPALASLWLLYPKAERAAAVATEPERGTAKLARSAQ